MLNTHKASQSSLISLILLFEREPALAQAQIESYIESQLFASKVIFGLGGLFVGLCFGYMAGKL